MFKSTWMIVVFFLVFFLAWGQDEQELPSLTPEQDQSLLFMQEPALEPSEQNLAVVEEEKGTRKEILLPDQSPLLFSIAYDLLGPQVAQDDEMGPLADEQSSQVKFLREFFIAYQRKQALGDFFDTRVGPVLQTYLEDLGGDFPRFQEMRISRRNLAQEHVEFRLKFFYPQAIRYGAVVVSGNLLNGHKILAFNIDTPQQISR
ncbi:MAG: hypothetical protein ACRCVN_04955 [Spirochaetia bacterium]